MPSQARLAAMSAIQTQLLQAAPDPNKTQPIPASANRATPSKTKVAKNNGPTPAQIEKERRLGEQARRLGEQARRKAILQGQLVVRTTTDALQRTGGVIEHVPTPGGLFVPLITLLVLWLALLPVNGHTRLVWFFLALTGQAHLSGVPSTEGQVLLPNPNVSSGGWTVPPVSKTTTTPNPTPTPTTTTNTGQQPVSKPQGNSSNSASSLSTVQHAQQTIKKRSVVDQLHHTTHI